MKKFLAFLITSLILAGCDNPTEPECITSYPLSISCTNVVGEIPEITINTYNCIGSDYYSPISFLICVVGESEVPPHPAESCPPSLWQEAPWTTIPDLYAPGVGYPNQEWSIWLDSPNPYDYLSPDSTEGIWVVAYFEMTIEGEPATTLPDTIRVWSNSLGLD